MERILKRAKGIGIFEVVFCVIFAIGFLICGAFAIIGLLGSTGELASALGGALAIIFGLLFGGSFLLGFIVALISVILNRKYCKDEEKFLNGKGYFITFSVIYYVLSLAVLLVAIFSNSGAIGIILLAIIIIMFLIVASFKLYFAIKIKKLKLSNKDLKETDNINI